MKEENKTEYAYIEIPVEKELPDDKAICFRGRDKMIFEWSKEFVKELKITHWLKKVPISSLPQIQELESWKRQAIEVMPDFQEIGKLLNVPLGQSVHDKIIPFIKKVVEAKEEWHKEQWADFFLKKAMYLSGNVGGGENWNRTIFEDKIIEVLIDVAIAVQNHDNPVEAKVSDEEIEKKAFDEFPIQEPKYSAKRIGFIAGYKAALQSKHSKTK